MKRNILLIAVIAVFSFSTFGQTKFESLTLSLTALKPEVLPLEPIPFKIEVTNNTDAAVTVDTSLSFNTSSVSLEVRNPSGKTLVPSQLSSLRGRTFFFPKDIAPGESIDSTEIFDFKTQVYFGKVGEYRLRASYKNKEGKLIRSDWVELTIVEPAGMDKSAYEYLREKMNGTFSPFTSWSSEDLEAFVLQYPANGYANYARYSLAERYFEKEGEKAEEQLRQIQDSGFFYAGEVGEKLKKLESQKKN